MEQTAAAVENWLDVQERVDGEHFEEDAEDLWRISALVIAGAGEAELNDAVRRARESGWAWGPIAMLLNETREQARHRLA